VTEDDNKAVVRRGVQIFNTRDWAQFEHIIAVDCLFHGFLSGLPSGPAGARELAARVGSAWPDDQWTIEELLAEGDRVMVRITSRATHLGRWLGLPPTGKRIEHQAILLFRIRDERIAEAWWFADDFTRLKQLGAHAILEDAPDHPSR